MFILKKKKKKEIKTALFGILMGLGKICNKKIITISTKATIITSS